VSWLVRLLLLSSLRLSLPGRAGAPRPGSAERAVPPASPLARAFETGDDAQQPPDDRRALTTGPPRGRQEERNEQGCKGPERPAGRAACGRAERCGCLRRQRQARLLRPEVSARGRGPRLGLPGDGAARCPYARMSDEERRADCKHPPARAERPIARPNGRRRLVARQRLSDLLDDPLLRSVRACLS